MAGIYVHIPFCRSRCAYCAFCSTTHLDRRERYLAAVAKEYALRRDYLASEPIRTIYLGGGTPSTLTRRQLTSLLTTLPTRADTVTEVTMECNPDDVTPALVDTMRTLGVNRVSLGIQTFDDQRLQRLHRRHSAQQARQAVTLLRQGGITNISLDIIFAFPHQTVSQCDDDIRQAIALNPQHISAYALAYEKGTPMTKLLQAQRIQELDEEASRKMYYHIIRQLSKAGYEQYEISNFARKGYQAQHNAAYWNDTPYLGLGAAAHSYNHNTRQWNTSNVDKYILSIEQGKQCHEQETITPTIHYNDTITTALRTRQGILLSKTLHNKEYLLDAAQSLINQKLLAITHNRLHLTHKALFIADYVLAQLIEA